MNTSLRELCVTVGYKCNFKCSHCAVADKQGVNLTGKELEHLIRVIKKRRFRALFFVGGETSLYIDDINFILERVGYSPEVKITTNGHFATSVDAAEKVLRKFSSLHTVHLSYDIYHAKFLPQVNVKKLFLACENLKIKFYLIYTVHSPMDLVQLRKFKTFGKFPVIVQKVHPVGAAKSNQLAYVYPSLDKRVLRLRCPNLGKIIYLCREGFTTCCSYLAMGENSKKYINPTIGGHLQSKFYKSISGNTLGALMKKKGIRVADLKPEHSSACALCRRIFEG